MKRLRIVKLIQEPEVPIRVLKETESHQYQFFGYNGFLGRAPCRGSVKKLTPKDVMNRSGMCFSDRWRTCNLVDGKGNVLDSMTVEKAWSGYMRGLYNEITLIPKTTPRISGVTC
jgi:hypothetical protein